MLLWRHLLGLSLVLCWLSALSSEAMGQVSQENETEGSEADSLDLESASDSGNEISVGILEDSNTVEETVEKPVEVIDSRRQLFNLLENASAAGLEAHPTTLLPLSNSQEKSFSNLPPTDNNESRIDSVVEDLSGVSVPSVVVPAGSSPNEHLSQFSPLESSSLENALSVIPIGIDVGDRNAVPSVLVKGTEDGSSLEQWLLPFDSVIQALGLTVEVLADGEWELRSRGLAVRLLPDLLQTDADIGLAISIEQITTLLGVPARFEQLDYAVRFDPPWLDAPSSVQSVRERPVLVEGLPTFQPSPFSVSGVAQQVSVSGEVGEDARTQGSFSGLGTAFGGSWYVRTEQPSLAADSWHISEFQYLRQTETADVALGSQPIFWNARSQSGDYWGASYVQRWGFEPPEPRGTGGFSPRQRLQAAAVGRTITGEALPGTLVQLTQGLRSVVVDEQLVDSSGLYRFEDVVSGRGGGSYQVLLYPNGQLTAIPESQSASFSTLPGQLPVGASALLVSGGLDREISAGGSTRFFGRFDGFRGGATYRRGLSETLTFGVGLVQDRTSQVLTEAFYAPDRLPLKVAVSALTDLQTADVDVTADVRFRPSTSFQMGFNSDRFSQRFSAEWRLNKGLSLLARGNTRDRSVAGGARFSWSKRNVFFFGSATIDTKNRARWNLSSRAGAWGMQHYGNEVTTQSEVSYNLSGNDAYGDGHRALLNYETQQSRADSQLATMSWHYRSARRAGDGLALWNTQLGYGVGSEGSGVVASLTTAIVPGVEIQARYQGISALDNRSTFQIELRPRLNFQGTRNIGSANRYQDRLRTQGGLLIQPFFDENDNGKRDKNEQLYRDNLDLLLSINYEDLRQYRPDIREQGAMVTLPPDRYRVDLDPAGYPFDWRAEESAYAAVTVAGQYTPVEIPLVRSYTLIGTVTDAQGNGIAGQKVEAVNVVSEESQLSVTNAAGVFYVEGLSQGDYRFVIDGTPVDEPLSLQALTEGLQEINFQILPDGIKTERFSSELEALAVEI